MSHRQTAVRRYVVDMNVSDRVEKGLVIGGKGGELWKKLLAVSE